MRISEDEVIRMNELYLEYHTYAAVAREVGRAPSTVKRYIDPNYKSQLSPKELRPVDWEKLGKVGKVSIATWEQDFLEGGGDESILP